MKTITIERENLKSILLNHLYPKGNITLLLQYTNMVLVGSFGMTEECATLHTRLPKDHWAFTQGTKPKRYVVDSRDPKVRDTIQENVVVGIFFKRIDAINYADMMNDR